MTDLVPLAVLMALVTYPARAVPLLVSTFARLQAPALAAVNTMVIVEMGADGSRHPVFHFGIEWLAVLACLGIVVWRKNLLAGIVIAVGLVAVVRVLGG